MHSVTLRDIYLARHLLQGQVTRTPLIRSEALSRRFGCDAWLKLENLQPIGAFKLRGASYAISRLTPEQAAKGVVTCSTGNHGRAIAYAGKQLGIRTVICMSSLVPDNKVGAIKALGAEVRIIGNSQDEAETEALRLVAEESMTYLPPFDHPDIIAGQGTIALEIMEDLPQVEMIFAGLSGGGLLSGIGLAAKGINPDIRIIGATMDKGAAMIASLEAGHPIQVTEYETLADSLGGGIGLENRHTFALVQEVVDQCWRVSEEAIARAMLNFLEEEKMLVEGAAVGAIAAIEEHRIDVRGKQIVLVISGQNVALDTFDQARKLAVPTHS
ncbi:hydroxyectoine utilization dehydratase EutB [Nitrincola alkalilacustris]|uniref:hydroxyectoine utilization dehydratase EutB n=1 Tax=Nitrincola alkalilacustris TaxID=1571224 RepID=UPI00124CA6B3|nr:hydroxyectoine utilization dehydratase EutB [Nitrincola alkalilacustris]